MGAEFLFMDDNARPHRANIVEECLQSEDITRTDWPAYSPVLNPIEHVVSSNTLESADVTLAHVEWYPTFNLNVLAWIYEAYPNTKFRFYLYPLQRSDRSSVHARQTLSIKEKHTCVIFRSLSATYALLCLFTMSVLIENPAACEIKCVIRFRNAKKVKPV
ncbi:DDE_3 domain-containing protein [Trichonephila clavipes]|uniref:DDE_3 domain-containing protein n=1 Tax=Trichonephila clavipes TaxID=2585209 RepID=A0A8X6R0G9_TRICX|nr:DDE_3 domain-containing protein [Trichonephila clavipes]